jgi:hypothetical protein
VTHGAMTDAKSTTAGASAPAPAQVAPAPSPASSAAPLDGAANPSPASAVRSAGGRPATNPSRWPREYRDKLRKAGSDLGAIVRANQWAREHGVPVEPAAELLERNARNFAPAPAAQASTPGPVLDVPFSQVPPMRAEPSAAPVSPLVEPEAPGAELVEPEAPSGSADDARASAERAPGAAAKPSAEPPEVEAMPEEEPAAPKRPPGESFMGENPDLVAALAAGPAFIIGALARLTEGGLVDLTKPVKVTLMRGTPHAREVDADPVARLSELVAVAMARRQEAAAAASADGEDGKPSLWWEALPLGAAFAVTVGAPLAGVAKSAAAAVGGWFLRGAQGAAGGIGRALMRRRS